MLQCWVHSFFLLVVREISIFVINICRAVAYSLFPLPPPPLAASSECVNPADGSLCNNAGVCGYDAALGAARCYCNNNYNETYCVDPVASAPSGAIAGATIGGILVGAFVVLVVPIVMWYSSRNGGGSSASSASVSAPGEGFYGDGAINQ